MTKKSIVTWVGVVSGLITILLVFENPLQNKAKLIGYVEEQEVVLYVKEKEIYQIKNNKDKLKTKVVVKLTLKNEGELPANKIHVKFRDGYDRAVIKTGKKLEEVNKDSPIYIATLEPDNVIEIFYFNSYFSIYAQRLEKHFSISSPDSGKADVRTDIKGEGIIWYIEEYFIFIIMFFVGLPVLLLFILADWYEKNKFAEKSDKNSFESNLEKLSHAWEIGVLSEEEYQAKGKELLDISIKAGS